MGRVRISGLERAIKRLGEAERRFRQPLERRATSLLAPARRAAAKYPPKRRGQIYQRTNRLKRGWSEGIPTIQSTRGRLSITLANVVEYSDEVQTEGEQRPIFADRWPTTEQIARQQEAPTAAIVDAINKQTAERFF